MSFSRPSWRTINTISQNLLYRRLQRQTGWQIRGNAFTQSAQQKLFILSIQSFRGPRNGDCRDRLMAAQNCNSKATDADRIFIEFARKTTLSRLNKFQPNVL